MNARSARPRAAALRLLGAPLRLAYVAWAAGSFLAVSLVILLLLVALPGVMRRRRAARLAAHTALALAGLRLRVRGARHLPAGQCVVVCNHASYLDGIALTAALPARFGFVIKREMAAVPLAGPFLRRLGSEFVERFDRHASARDARRVLRNAVQGASLVFFPEGTFTREPGLMPFHTGAFASAVRAGCPLVPVVLRGTRRALAPGRPLPRPGRLELEILPALAPPSGAAAGPRLREQARAAMLAALGEPDLTCCGGTGRPPGTAPARSARASRP